jgi:uncharacterized membrane protein YedE/YeeE
MSAPARRPYADGTLVGVALGAVLLASFVMAGRGLGASGAFADVAGNVVERLAPGVLAADPALADRVPAGVSLLDDWIVLEVIGVAIGAALSAWMAGRLRSDGPVSAGRLTRAVAGGALMGVGARLAYGCTSGLALSGGALLATGAWIFIAIAFATAVLVAVLARRAGEEPW